MYVFYYMLFFALPQETDSLETRAELAILWTMFCVKMQTQQDQNVL